MSTQRRVKYEITTAAPSHNDMETLHRTESGLVADKKTLLRRSQEHEFVTAVTGGILTVESTQARVTAEWHEHMLSSAQLRGCGAQHCHQMATVLTERKPRHLDGGPTLSSIQMNLKKDLGNDFRV